QQVTDGLRDMNQQVQGLSGQVPQQMAGQLQAFSQGIDELIAGNESVQDGIEQVGPGVSDGTAQLVDGNNQMKEGLEGLDSELDEMIGEVGDGRDEFDGPSTTDENAGFISDPIEVTEPEVTDIKNSGQPFAPSIIAVSMFLGCIG